MKELCRELGNDEIIGRVPLWRDDWMLIQFGFRKMRTLRRSETRLSLGAPSQPNQDPCIHPLSPTRAAEQKWRASCWLWRRFSVGV